jgi:GxxExxY protein
VHRLYDKASKLSREVIGAAMEVHRHKGPGLIESIYERYLLRELELRSIPATTKKLVRVEYKGLVFDEPLRFDILVDDCLLVELKAVEILQPSSKAQLFSCMKLLDIPVGLLINSRKLSESIFMSRFSKTVSPESFCPEQIEQKKTKAAKCRFKVPARIFVSFVVFCERFRRFRQPPHRGSQSIRSFFL